MQYMVKQISGWSGERKEKVLLAQWPVGSLGHVIQRAKGGCNEEKKGVLGPMDLKFTGRCYSNNRNPGIR